MNNSALKGVYNLCQNVYQHRVDLEWAKQKAGATWENNDLVFPNRAGKFLDNGTNLARFYKVLESAGLLRMRVHDLRHNVGTLLMSMGVYPKVVQELLGHSDVAITLGLYGHAVPGMHNAAMDKWKGFLQEADTDKNQKDTDENQDHLGENQDDNEEV